VDFLCLFDFSFPLYVQQGQSLYQQQTINTNIRWSERSGFEVEPLAHALFRTSHYLIDKLAHDGWSGLAPRIVHILALLHHLLLRLLFRVSSLFSSMRLVKFTFARKPQVKFPPKQQVATCSISSIEKTVPLLTTYRLSNLLLRTVRFPWTCLKFSSLNSDILRCCKHYFKALEGRHYNLSSKLVQTETEERHH